MLDSPAFFTSIRQRGLRIAEEACARYRIIECVLSDLEAIQERLDGRLAKASQPRVAYLAAYSRAGEAPLAERHLRLDTCRPLDDCLADALAYLRT